ncbi:hypothetical protein ACIBFB_02440 [Nocardiopsis sp. NPDC050513]|uniref:hypothetical protein n=1 Tax=Nocardiopsis sp. NPDC050513 TaxID=3364338 RepID=UPI0037B1FE3C
MRNLGGRFAVRPVAVGLALTTMLAVSACGERDVAGSAPEPGPVGSSEETGAPEAAAVEESPAPEAGASDRDEDEETGGDEDTADGGGPSTPDRCGGLWNG